MVLVPDLMKSLRDHLTSSSRRTGANTSSTMEMVDPDTGEIISQHNAAADPAAYKNAKGTKARSQGPSCLKC